MRFRFFVTILACLPALNLAWWWLADSKLRPLRRPRIWRGLLAGFVLLQLALLAYCVITRKAWQPRNTGWVMLLSAVYLWHLLVVPIWLLGYSLLEAIKGAIGAGKWIWASAELGPSEAESPATTLPSSSAGLTRRQLLGATAAAVPPLLAFSAAGAATFELGDFRIRSLDVVVPALPPALEGLTIAHVTDVHVGKFTRPGILQTLAERVNRLRADLVLLTGDLIDVSLADLPAALDMVRHLDPRHGLFLCEGNHDLIQSGPRFEAAMRASGLPILLDECASIRLRGEAVQFLGPRWARGDEAISELVNDLADQSEPAAFRILLAHHPHAFDRAAARGLPLTLSGHTHGEQLMLNERLGAGPVLFRYWSGVYEKGDSRLVVSNGVGNWFPLRINAPAEVIHLTLHRTA